MTTDFSGYRRILVALDFSPHSETALRQAIWLANKSSAQLTLAHVLPDDQKAMRSASIRSRLNLLYGDGAEFQQEVLSKYESQMRRLIAKWGSSALDVKYEVLLGEPFVALSRAAHASAHDLVLSGNRGHTPLEQVFLGSTTKRLIRKCPSSVWGVKAEHVGPPSIVLATTDFSDVSFKSVNHALWIAQRAGAEFHLLHVIDSSDVPPDIVANIPEGSSLRNEINTEAKSRLDDFVATLPVEPEKVRRHLSWGMPWKEVSRLAKHIQADLVALGTVGRSGIRGVVLGNTAERVLADCDCSILTVKPDDYVSPLQFLD